jgi:hypothetical protein
MHSYEKYRGASIMSSGMSGGMSSGTSRGMSRGMSTGMSGGMSSKSRRSYRGSGQVQESAEVTLHRCIALFLSTVMDFGIFISLNQNSIAGDKPSTYRVAINDGFTPTFIKVLRLAYNEPQLQDKIDEYFKLRQYIASAAIGDKSEPHSRLCKFIGDSILSYFHQFSLVRSQS